MSLGARRISLDHNVYKTIRKFALQHCLLPSRSPGMNEAVSLSLSLSSWIDWFRHLNFDFDMCPASKREKGRKKEILYITLFSCRDAFWALRSGTDHFHVNGYKSWLTGLSWIDLSIYHFPAQNPLMASWNPVKSSLHHSLDDQTQSYPWLLLQSYFLPHLNILLGLY